LHSISRQKRGQMKNAFENELKLTPGDQLRDKARKRGGGPPVLSHEKRHHWSVATRWEDRSSAKADVTKNRYTLFKNDATKREERNASKNHSSNPKKITPYRE